MVICLSCGERAKPPSQDLKAGVAGASAGREHARRCQALEERARGRLGGLGVGLLRLVGDPQHVEAWKRGQAGEVRAAKRFERHLKGSVVRLLHDRRIPGTRANIDHLAVGPGGVTVIDTKNYSGKVRLRTQGGLFSARKTVLRVGDRDRSRLVDGMRRQIELVQRALAESDLLDVPIDGALCFVNGEELPLFRRLVVDGVLIDGPRRVAKLAARRGSLDSDRVDAIYRTLATRLPPA